MSNALNRDVREIIREEPAMHGQILQVLDAGPLTVPEIASAINQPSEEVVFWVMGMRRYGRIIEIPEANDDGYFLYAKVVKGVH
jgi:predicted Rossmann fold nucleotide-binding protein DprA/Smf involved in DNA uptake